MCSKDDTDMYKKIFGKKSINANNLIGISSASQQALNKITNDSNSKGVTNKIA